MSGKNTDVSFRVGEDRFLLKGETVTHEVPLLFELLYAHFVDPGFRKEAYERFFGIYSGRNTWRFPVQSTAQWNFPAFVFLQEETIVLAFLIMKISIN